MADTRTLLDVNGSAQFQRNIGGTSFWSVIHGVNLHNQSGTFCLPKRLDASRGGEQSLSLCQSTLQHKGESLRILSRSTNLKVQEISISDWKLSGFFSHAANLGVHIGTESQVRRRGFSHMEVVVPLLMRRCTTTQQTRVTHQCDWQEVSCWPLIVTLCHAGLSCLSASCL